MTATAKSIEIGRFMGPLIYVRYPSHKRPHLYIAWPGGAPLHCCQCGADFLDGLADLMEHIHFHAPRRDKRIAASNVKAFAHDYAPGDETI